MAPVVEALWAMWGVSLVAASALVAEVGDMRRFGHPRQLTAHLGLVPSEYSSGSKRRQGAITKTGRQPARAAHARRGRLDPSAAGTGVGADEAPPRRPAAGGARNRLEGAAASLCARYRRLQATGKRPQVVVTAIAREMAGFAWAIARMVAPPPAAA